MRDYRYLLSVLAAGSLIMFALTASGCGSTSSNSAAPAKEAAPSADQASDDSSDDEGYGTDTSADASVSSDGKISKASFDGEWPLTVKSGTLSCVGSGGVGKVWLRADDGTTYAINGLAVGEAKANGGHVVDEIWGEPDKYGLRPDVTPIIDAGLALCE